MKNVIRPSYDLYINGRWVPSSDGSTFKAINPANGEVLSVCAEATQDDVNAAVRAAQAAFPAWKNVSPRKRQAILLKIADIIDKNADTLALIETLDNGKPIRETRPSTSRQQPTISATSPASSAAKTAGRRPWTTTR